MQGRRKTFRIEAVNELRGQPRAGGPLVPALPHQEIMNELKALRAIVEPREAVSQHVLDAYKAQITEAQKLKTELDIISDAIENTKKEIAALHVAGFEGPEMVRVTHELDAVVEGTERATQQILTSAETIDQAANLLSAAVKNEQDKTLASDIQEQVIRIFEACNFQDLTGQRIDKVVATLKFIESHIMRMIEIWGGIEAFHGLTRQAAKLSAGPRKLTGGPKLDGAPGHAVQEEIDRLFASI